MSEIIDVVEPSVPGPQGKSGTIKSATGKTLPAGQQVTVELGGTPEERTIEFGIPEGEQGTPATITSATAETLPPQSEATVTVGGTPDARTFTFGIPKGDPGSGSVNSVNGDFGPDITLDAADVGGSTAATSGTMPLRTTGGRLPGIGDPSLVADAANKRYVDNSLQTALETVASVDDLIFTTRHDCSYSGANAIVEFTNTTVHTVMVAPFALEITSVVLSFERFSIARDASNYVRAWPQRIANGQSVHMATHKNTSTASGGEAITARKAWSLSDAGLFDNIAAKDDLIAVVLGVTGSPDPIKYPFTVTMTYRPI